MYKKAIVIFQIFFLIQSYLAEDIWPTNCPRIKEVKCSGSKYYSADGSCNNLKIHWWGKSDTALARFLPPQYDDGVDSPRTRTENGNLLPNSREVSLKVHYPKHSSADARIKVSHYGTMFGQFFSFDMTRISPGNVKCTCGTRNPECFNIPTPPHDKIDSNQKCMVFIRSKSSSPTFNCESRERQQLNIATHWIDLSQIYGSEQKLSLDLRASEGLLKTTSIPGFQGEYLQFANLGSCTNDSANRLCFRSGDARVNENMILTSIFTVFVREHNRLAKELRKLNPKWSSETLYHETRRVLVAVYQKIVFEDYIPILLDDKHIRTHGLSRSKGHFMNYDSSINPQVRNEFSTSAGRFGHTLVNSFGSKSTPSLSTTSNINFRLLLLQPGEAYTGGGLDSLCRGSIIDKSSGYDAHFTNPIQNYLFENPSPKAQTHQQSLSALNINRGRDHGTRSYIAYRKFCDLRVAESFEDLHDIPADTRRDLKKVYKSVDEIDLFTGIVSEKSLRNAVVGPLAACLLGKQFHVLKHGDRLFYENGHDKKTMFSTKQLREIRKMTMARIICDNVEVDKIQKNVFLLPDSDSNPFISCRHVKRMNMEVWKT